MNLKEMGHTQSMLENAKWFTVKNDENCLFTCFVIVDVNPLTMYGKKTRRKYHYYVYLRISGSNDKLLDYVMSSEELSMSSLVARCLESEGIIQRSFDVIVEPIRLKTSP